MNLNDQYKETRPYLMSKVTGLKKYRICMIDLLISFNSTLPTLPYFFIYTSQAE